MPSIKYIIDNLPYHTGYLLAGLTGYQLFQCSYNVDNHFDADRITDENGTFVPISPTLVEYVSDILTELKVPFVEGKRFNFVLVNKLNPISFGSVKSHGALVGLPDYYRIESLDDLNDVRFDFLESADQAELLFKQTLLLSPNAKRYAIARTCVPAKGFLYLFLMSTPLACHVAFNVFFQSAYKSGLISSTVTLVPLLAFASILTVYSYFFARNHLQLYYQKYSVDRICKTKNLDLIEGGIEFCEQMLARHRLLNKHTSNFKVDLDGNELSLLNLPLSDLKQELNRLKLAKTRLANHLQAKRISSRSEPEVL